MLDQAFNALVCWKTRYWDMIDLLASPIFALSPIAAGFYSWKQYTYIGTTSDCEAWACIGNGLISIVLLLAHDTADVLECFCSVNFHSSLNRHASSFVSLQNFAPFSVIIWTCTGATNQVSQYLVSKVLWTHPACLQHLPITPSENLPESLTTTPRSLRRSLRLISSHPSFCRLYLHLLDANHASRPQTLHHSSPYYTGTPTYRLPEGQLAVRNSQQQRLLLSTVLSYYLILNFQLLAHS